MLTDAQSRLTSALAGRYTIERELGAGGMATVYLAHDVRHDRKVALKLLRPELAAILGGERFLKEIRLTANLQHPHILGLHDSGEVDGLVKAVVVPAPGPRSGGTYRRHTPRRELDIAVVGVAAQLTLSNGVCAKARIALAAVAPIPVRATAAEQALEGREATPDRIARAADLAVEAARPISDQRGSADFRRHLVGVLTRRALATALARAST